jgi:hypothetical protein
MKINEKLGYNKITAGWENLRSNPKYPITPALSNKSE